MSKILDGKVALVTGASSGIGEGTALALAGAGATVAVFARRADRLEALIAKIEANGGKAIAITGDIAVEADAVGAVETTVAKLGRIDIVVNAAGVNEAGGVGTLTLDQWRRVMDINFYGTLYTCSAAVPHMKAQGAGDIINISSTSGRRAAGLFGPYSTSKFAVTGLTECLRQEVGLDGIRVGIVEPGATESEIGGSITDPKWAKAIEEHVTKDGAMKPSDIADAILMMVSLPRRANVAQILVRPVIDVTPM